MALIVRAPRPPARPTDGSGNLDRFVEALALSCARRRIDEIRRRRRRDGSGAMHEAVDAAPESP